MGLAWVGLSLKHPEVPLLADLRLETYGAFSKFVLGPEVAGKTKYIPHRWRKLLEVEFLVRCEWFETVRALNVTLDFAILMSIGVKPGYAKSDHWQELSNWLIQDEVDNRSGGGKGKGNKNYDSSSKRSWQEAFGDNRGPKGNKKGNWSGKDNSWTGNKGLKGKSGKDSKKGGKAKEFVGKLSTCARHRLSICFAFHTRGCNFGDSCRLCHQCCPEPGCTKTCGRDHGLWSH